MIFPTCSPRRPERRAGVDPGRGAEDALLADSVSVLDIEYSFPAELS
jgi:hypothetical protein